MRFGHVRICHRCQPAVLLDRDDFRGNTRTEPGRKLRKDRVSEIVRSSSGNARKSCECRHDCISTGCHVTRVSFFVVQNERPRMFLDVSVENICHTSSCSTVHHGGHDQLAFNTAFVRMSSFGWEWVGERSHKSLISMGDVRPYPDGCFRLFPFCAAATRQLQQAARKQSIQVCESPRRPRELPLLLPRWPPPPHGRDG